MMFRLTKITILLLLLGNASSFALAGASQEEGKKAEAAAAKLSKKPIPHAPVPVSHLLTADDGLAVIAAALETRPRLSSETDCSHLVHRIYERAGFIYSYKSSAELYAGAPDFRHILHPRPGDLVVWPGHVGIVVSPAQHAFYSALRTGRGIDSYDAPYWKGRGRARFYRYVKQPEAQPVAKGQRLLQTSRSDK
jgi:cell wall-associated NlpC family hydrolase